MKRNKLGWVSGILFGCAILLAQACSDSDEPAGKGQVQFEMTDAPSDDASIKGVFVTVTDIKADGKSISGFSKQTIDLKAYQDGNTKVLGNTSLDARTYSTLTLVLDVNQDASGNSPGCYVLTTDNIKHKLKNSAEGTLAITLDKSWRVAKNASSKIVLDFDLRKSIQADDDPAIRYTFASDNNLRTAVRLVNTESAGNIEGSYSESNSSDADKIVVYAYRKGTFNAATETEAQDGILFRNAVTSAEVKSTLTGKVYTLAFLEEGEYELYFAGYTKNSTTGRFEMSAMLESETTVDGSVSNIVKVQGGVTIKISTSITGIL